MIPKFALPCLMLAALFATGCSSPQTFDVIVTNKLSDPITVWMTKAQPPKNGEYERGWMPPEAAAVGNVDATQPLGGVPVVPGQSVHAHVTGKISGNDVAVLRIYHSVDMNTILAMNASTPDRLDIPLDPGKTDIDIVLQNGQLSDVPHTNSSPPTTGAR